MGELRCEAHNGRLMLSTTSEGPPSPRGFTCGCAVDRDGKMIDVYMECARLLGTLENEEQVRTVRALLILVEPTSRQR